MDNGTLALLLSPVLIFAAALITQIVVRRNTREANDIDRFEAILQGQTVRIETLEAEVKELQEKRRTDRVEITRLRTIVRAWFDQLKAAWVDQPHPMPLPPEEDMDFLGITSPPVRRKT